MLHDDAVEIINKKLYEKSYDPSKISLRAILDTRDYFYKLSRIRLDILREYGSGKNALDLCCGPGDYLLESSRFIESGVGIDFSDQMIEESISVKKMRKIANVEFLKGNARKLPFRDQSFGMIFSFSALYCISRIESAVHEVSRCLRDDGHAILEFGNLYSLNTFVCRSYPDLSISCHLFFSEIKEVVAGAGMEVVQWRRFQVFPLWGNRPWWLKPLLLTFWKKVMQKEVRGKMVDEWICKLPLLRRFSFRQLLICRKA